MDNPVQSTPEQGGNNPQSQPASKPVSSSPAPVSSGATPNIAPVNSTSSIASEPTSFTAPNENQAKPVADTSATTLPKSTTSTMDNKHTKSLTVILLLLLVLVLAGGLYTVYAYQQNKINKLKTTNSAINTEVSKLRTEVSTSSAPSLTINEPSASSTNSVIKIPEINVSLTVPDTLADLTYTANTANNSVNITTKSLTELDNACASNATAGMPLGALIKVNGKFNVATVTSSTTLVKQYPNYYIGYVKAGAPCSKDAQVNALVIDLTSDLRSSFNSIETIN